jgi:hypothetical protein
MQLKVHSDAAYLVEPEARSRFGGHMYLGNHKLPEPHQGHNGAIQTNASSIKNVVNAASDAETAGVYNNCIDAIPIRTTLQELGHSQARTPVTTDNSTTAGFANRTIKQRRSKAMDMRYYWLQDREAQGQFKISWDKGSENLADYFTKHFSAKHHQLMRTLYLHVPATAANAHCLRGYANPGITPNPSLGNPETINRQYPTYGHTDPVMIFARRLATLVRQRVADTKVE